MDHSDFGWLTDHSLEIHRQYAGKCIAVLNGKVIGVGATVTEAAKQAEERYPGAAYVLEKVEADTERV